MKLIGAIAFLVLLTVGCQKEDIRPNTQSTPSWNTRAAEDGDGTTEDDTVIDNGGTTDGTLAGGGEGITDPKEDKRTSKTPRPKQPL